MRHKTISLKLSRVYMQCILMIIFNAFATAGEGTEPFIQEAYQLRINGKADQAETLLRSNLKTDTTNALAWFELARTKHHLFLGQGRFSPESWKEVTDYANKSVLLDPENEIFAFYYAYCRLTDAFISLMQGQQDAKDKTNAAGESFRKVLNINPDCFAAKLYLIDIYGLLPADMGGDKEVARKVAESMKSDQPVYYAMGLARLLPDTADLVAYWQNFVSKEGMNAQAMEELGRAFLLKSDMENGKKYYNDAMHSDPGKTYLIMNLVRYLLMSSQQDQSNKDTYLKAASEFANNYIQSDPEPIPPFKAHAYSILAMISMFGNDQEGANKYNEMAVNLDPYCSKASGMPPDLLYSPPDKVMIRYSSFFMPF